MTVPPSPSPDASQPDTTSTASLDTLRFQDIVDDAKRLIPQLYPEWTDHNVSDPGITLIEAFAARIDELSYRLGRIPIPVRDAYLRLLAPSPRLAVPARALLTFTRAPGTTDIVSLEWPAEICVGTNDPTVKPVIFTTLDQVLLPPESFFDYGYCPHPSWPPDGENTQPQPYQPNLAHDHIYTTGTDDYRALVLAADPGPNKTLPLHLDIATPGTSTLLPGILQWRIATSDPQQSWQGLATLGNPHPDQLTGPGQVLLKIPRNRKRYAVTPARGSTPIICVALELTVRPMVTADNFSWSISTLYPPYTASASVAALQKLNAAPPDRPTALLTTQPFFTTPQPPFATMTSNGLPGQRLRLPNFPVPTSDDTVYVTVQPPGALLQTWTYSPSFATASSEDACFTFDANTSEIVFGPKITTAHGSQQCGRIPEPGAVITAWASTTQGAAGNVAAGTLTLLLNNPQAIPDTILNTHIADHLFLGDLCVTLRAIPGDTSHTTAEPTAERWPPLQGHHIDAALQTPQQNLCFFFGDQCLTLTDSPPPDPAPGVPQRIKEFLHLDQNHGDFADGIDAAARVGTTSYLFKGPNCLVIPDKDFATRPPARPLPITSVFYNLPDYFTEDLHAASSDHAHLNTLLLIRGGLYARVSQNVYESQGMVLSLWPSMAEHASCTVTVTNPAPAIGGEDPKSLNQLIRDTPFGLATPRRAVTGDELTTALRDTTPGLGRAISRPSPPEYDLQILLIPDLAPGSQPTLRSLTPSPGLYTLAQQALDSLRLLGARIQLAAPVYQTLDVTADIIADLPPNDYPRLRDQVRDALARTLHPLTGGPNNNGWPLDRPPTTADISQALYHLSGIDHVTNVDIDPAEFRITSGVLPLLGALNLTINGFPLRDRDILGGTDDHTAERSMTIQFTTERSWNRISCMLTNGYWTAEPPTCLTANTDPAPPQLACNVTDPASPLDGSVTYQLAGTTEQVTLKWTNPPAGVNTYESDPEPPADVFAEFSEASETVGTGVQIRDRNDAHPNMQVELFSTVQRTHAITVKDGTNDEWELIEKADNCNPSEESGRLPCTFTVTSGDFEEFLDGYVTYRTESWGEERIEITWSADSSGNVIYAALSGPELSALLDGQPLDSSGITKGPDSAGGGFKSHAEITLQNDKHRSIDIKLAHSLAGTLAEAEPYRLDNGTWIIVPPEFIPRGSQKPARATVDAAAENMTGSVSYTCQLGGKSFDLRLNWTIPHGSEMPEYRIIVPAGALVRANLSEWDVISYNG
ncbi:hypothetical protein [Streptomyces murinus]|uniref:hypothetical protein n=1 Tax=Streptomyces murinus TaxID=33900 RepID=UPI00382751FD